MKKKNSILILYGPTGVGKTDCAVALAQRMNGEIINMDMGALYTPLSIGTAKPDWQSYPIPHHLFDIIDSPRNVTVVEYRSLVVSLLKSIWERGKMPILVGGSGFYLKSLFFPPANAPISDESEHYGHLDPKNLWAHLYDIDPTRARSIDPHDVYRIKRALDIWYSTGIKPSAYKPQFQPIAPFFLFFLRRSREELYARIDKRVIQMFDAGWESEVRQLMNSTWASFIKEKKIIGYDDILDYLHSHQTAKEKDALIKKIETKTRNYAKRQFTFWRSLQKDLQDALAEYTDSNLVANSLITEIDTTHQGCEKQIEKIVHDTQVEDRM